MTTAEPITQAPLVLRRAGQDDVPFICNSWVKSYLKDAKWLHRDQVEQAVYFEEHRALIGHILERCGALIACNPEAPTQIFGYLVGERIGPVFVAHWVYVKQNFRNLGIAKRLFAEQRGDALTVYCTHWSPLAAGKRDKWGLNFNPYLTVRI